MPSTADHLAKAKQNEAFLAAIRGIEDAADWGVTSLFYVAVHYGRAFLSGKSNAVTTHQHFQSVFVRVANDPVAYGYYRSLQTESEASRYDCKKYDWADVDALLDANLLPFKAALARLGLPL